MDEDRCVGQIGAVFPDAVNDIEMCVEIHAMFPECRAEISGLGYGEEIAVDSDHSTLGKLPGEVSADGRCGG